MEKVAQPGARTETVIVLVEHDSFSIIFPLSMHPDPPPLRHSLIVPADRKWKPASEGPRSGTANGGSNYRRNSVGGIIRIEI